MNIEISNEISKLQNNLQTIRKVAGWTTEELGNRIGVTKQTISNLENKKTDMTKTQYIALRTILDYEIASNSDSIALARVVDVLLNVEEPPKTEKIAQSDERKNLNENSNILGKSLVTATVATAASSVAESIAMSVTSGWLAKIMKDSK